MSTDDRRVRERVLAAATSFDQIDAVVMTTFGFGADFLEEHALAAALGLEGDATAARRQAVHEALAVTPVSVAFDATTGSVPSGRYRYVAVPVPLAGRLFHPKVILIGGRTAEGHAGVWAGVGSANLTLSGWGRNAESFAEVWLSSARQQPVGVLSAFLDELIDLTGVGVVDPRTGFSAMRDLLGALPTDAGLPPTPVGWEGPLDGRIYVSSVHSDGFAAFLGEQVRGSHLRCFSPYWSDIPAQLQRFGVGSADLVPALRQDGVGVGLLRQQATALPRTVGIHRNLIDDGSRFWHAKAYEFTGVDEEVVTAVGSCNFSSPGLSGATGNVEVMLVRSEQGHGFPTPEQLSSLSLDDLPVLPQQDDSAPEPPPVGIVVLWDWSEEKYRWTIEDGGKDRSYVLELPHQVVQTRAGTGHSEGSAPKPAAPFVLTWVDGGRQEGTVVEVNLHLSPRSYGRQLKASEILDSWRGRTVFIGGDGDGADDRSETHDETHAEEATELPFDVFDLFDFHRSLRRLQEAVREATDRPSIQRALLLTRPDSVWAMAHLTAQANAPAALRFLVLDELARTADHHNAVIDSTSHARLAALVHAARQETVTELGAELGDANEAEAMVRWFEEKSIGMGARP